jgi:hypothetical protein
MEAILPEVSPDPRNAQLIASFNLRRSEKV